MMQVVAALLWQNERFLIGQRPHHKARGLLWEFIGGKVEPGETPMQALIRECREELAVEIAVDELFGKVTHVYPDLTVQLSLFSCRLAPHSPPPQALEHNALHWITPEQIDDYDFCPADVELLQKIRLVYSA